MSQPSIQSVLEATEQLRADVDRSCTALATLNAIAVVLGPFDCNTGNLVEKVRSLTERLSQQEEFGTQRERALCWECADWEDRYEALLAKHRRVLTKRRRAKPSKPKTVQALA